MTDTGERCAEEIMEAFQWGRYAMATKATHKAGDISRDEPDLCFVYAVDGENYVGAWEAGYGMMYVRFPKGTTRELTAEEREHYGKMWLSAPWGSVKALSAPEVGSLNDLPAWCGEYERGERT